VGPALGKSRGLELVDQRDHRAGIDAHRRAELLLVGSVARAEEVEEPEERRSQPERLERRRDAGMRRPPEPEEQLARELGERGVVGFGRHLSDLSSTRS
jgi:hypothetical protein